MLEDGTKNNDEAQVSVKIIQNTSYKILAAKFLFDNRPEVLVTKELNMKISITVSKKDSSFRMTLSYTKAKLNASEMKKITRLVSLDSAEKKILLPIINSSKATICKIEITPIKQDPGLKGRNVVRGNKKQLQPTAVSRKLAIDKSEQTHDEKYSIASQYSYKQVPALNFKHGLRRYKSISNKQLASNSSSVTKNSKKHYFNRVGYISKPEDNSNARNKTLLEQKDMSELASKESNTHRDVASMRYNNIIENLHREESTYSKLRHKKIQLNCQKYILRKDFDCVVDSLKTMEKKKLELDRLKDSPKLISSNGQKNNQCRSYDNLVSSNRKASSDDCFLSYELDTINDLQTQYTDLLFERNELVNIKNRLIRKKEKQKKARGFVQSKEG